MKVLVICRFEIHIPFTLHPAVFPVLFSQKTKSNKIRNERIVFFKSFIANCLKFIADFGKQTGIHDQGVVRMFVTGNEIISKARLKMNGSVNPAGLTGGSNHYTIFYAFDRIVEFVGIQDPEISKSAKFSVK